MQNIVGKFEKMFAHIAFGLKEKLGRPNPEEYKYGLLLRQGINMFCALAVEFSGMKSDVLKSYLISLNETEMICNKFVYPVNEWFSGWDESLLQELKLSCFWELGPLIYLNEGDRNYILTEECLDYLHSTEKDLSAIDEHIVYNLMKEHLSQDNYVYIRKYIIEHPLLTEIERKKLLLHFNNEQFILEIFENAYEKVPEETFHCPNCGWTMTFKGVQPECCHRDCIENNYAKKDKCKKVEPEYAYRLKRGVMRYICYPGKAELEIEDICKKLNVKNELWPEFDRYDIKVIFSDGTCWGIDAKTNCNPYFLSKMIENDIHFKSANIDKGFYVIPDKIVKRVGGYLKICDRALLRDKNFKCISLSTFKKLIKKELEK